jgi:hypothetical protein
MKRLLSRILIGLFVLAAIVTAGWVLAYSDRGDPKNIKYVLWKHGLYPYTFGFTGNMTHDSSAKELVIGKTKEQLERKFGKLVSLAEASLYLKQEYEEYPYQQEKDVCFIAESWWMVVFNGDKASDLVLCKG